MPSKRFVLDFHPKELIFFEFISFLGVPSGLDLSKINFPLKPITSPIVLARFKILTSLPEPTLIC